MIPASITSTDANNTVIVFSGSVQGTAVLSTGVGNETLALATSASFATTASFAVTASTLNTRPQYISVGKTADQAGITTSTDITFDVTNASNGLTLSGNSITLTGGRVYEIAYSGFIFGSAACQLELRLFDSTNAVAPNINANYSRMVSISAGGNVSNLPSATFIYAPTNNVTVKLRAVFASGTPSLANAGCTLVITEIR